VKSWSKYAFVFSVVMIIASSAAGAVRVFSQVNTEDNIYVGENFNYHIIIEGDNKAAKVDMSALAEYEPRSAGNKDYSETSIRIVNGKTTRTVKKQFVMSYSLSASKLGQVQLPGVKVLVGGTVYKTAPVTVNILEPAITDNLELQVSLSKQKCFVGQAVLLTVKFYISTEVGDFQFNIPAFNGDDFHVEDHDKPDPQTKQFQLRNGVVVNVSQYRLTYKDKETILLSFSKILIPKNPGRIELAPSEVSVDVVVGQSRRSFFGVNKKYKRFMAHSESLAMEVLPLPQENRPNDFYGLVGNYKISASAEPTKVHMGDPITLTIKIGGNDYLKSVQWPRLERIPEMMENFKVPSEKSSPTIEDGFKIFTQTIRPIKNDVKAIPSIPLVIFDVDKGVYFVEKTKPISLDVVPTKLLTVSDMQGSDLVPMNKEVEVMKKGLSANYDGLDVLQNQKFSVAGAITAPGYLVIWALPMFVLLASISAKLITHTTPEKEAARRRRRAYRKSIDAIRKIHSAKVCDRNEMLATAMRQYLGDRFDKNAGALAADDCYELIVAATKDEQLAGRYREAFANCQASRYASMETEVGAKQISNIVKLIKTIEKKCR